ncbi:glycine cleavage system protein GcvH [Cupriavidus sp. CP313]
MNIPEDRMYTETHEWARLEPDRTMAVGITEHAQDSLGDIVGVELPEMGRAVTAAESVATVESVKAASDIHSPISGEIVAINHEAIADPGRVNSAPYDTWLFRVKPSKEAEFVSLMAGQAYAEAVGD